MQDKSWRLRSGLNRGRQNYKKIWSYIKSQRNEKTGIADIFDKDTWISDPKQQANLFNEQFCKDQLSTPPNPSDNVDNPQITNIIVSAQLDEARPLVDGNNIFSFFLKTKIGC